MVRAKFSKNAMPFDDNAYNMYPKEVLDLLIIDPDVVEIIDIETGEVLLSR